MNEIHADLLLIIKCSPGHREILKTLFLKSKEFQNICEDYRRCQEALAFWTKTDNKNSVKPREEYSLLLLELEAEILQIRKENS